MTRRLIALQIRARQVLDRDRGATAVEYGLLVALIAGAIIITVGLLGGQLNGAFLRIRQQLP